MPANPRRSRHPKPSVNDSRAGMPLREPLFCVVGPRRRISAGECRNAAMLEDYLVQSVTVHAVLDGSRLPHGAWRWRHCGNGYAKFAATLTAWRNPGMQVNATHVFASNWGSISSAEATLAACCGVLLRSKPDSGCSLVRRKLPVEASAGYATSRDLEPEQLDALPVGTNRSSDCDLVLLQLRKACSCLLCASGRSSRTTTAHHLLG